MKNESYSSLRNDMWDSKTEYPKDHTDATHTRFFEKDRISPKSRGKVIRKIKY